MWTIFKVCMNLLQYCSCFIFFGHEGRRIFAPPPGTESAPPALEGEILTTGPPGKSSHVSLHAGGRGGLGYRRGEGNVVMKRATAMMRPWAEECHGILTLPAAGRSRELTLPWSLQKESAVDTLILVLEDSFQTVCLQNYKRIYFCCFKPLFFFFYSNEKWPHCSFCLNCSSPRWLNGCLP